MANRRNTNINHQVTENGNGQIDGNMMRWNPNDRYRDRRGNVVNHRVNLLDTDNGPGYDRAPYWMRNHHRRGYWNPRSVNRDRRTRTDRESEGRHRPEDRNYRDSRSRSHSPNMHQNEVENPVERLLNNQNVRGIGNGEDRRQRTPSDSLNQ